MIELLILICGIVALWKFSDSINVTSDVASEKAKAWAEDMIADAVDKRQETNAKVDKIIEKHGKIISHEALMAKLKGH